MARLRGQAGGEGRVGLIIALVVCGLVIHSGLQYVPVIITENEFMDHIQDSLKEVSAGTMTKEHFLKDVMLKAKDLELPVSEHMIVLNETAAQFSVKVGYSVTVGWLWGDAERKVMIEKSYMKIST